MTKKQALRSLATKRLAASNAIRRFAAEHGGDLSELQYRRTNFRGEYRLAIGDQEAGIGFEISPLEREALAA